MAKKSEDRRVGKAASWYAQIHDMKLYEAMRAANFSEEEAGSKAWQMVVRRHPNYKKKKEKIPLTVTVPRNKWSPYILDLSEPSEETIITRSISKRTNCFSKSSTKPVIQINGDRETEAHKVATLMYEKERKKRKNDETKKSARAITDIVNDQYGSNLSARTVLRYSADGMAGQSPLRAGRKRKEFKEDSTQPTLCKRIDAQGSSMTSPCYDTNADE